MANNPIHLTILRRGEIHIVDLAEVQAIIPRSETRVDATFLEEISQEIKRITNLVGPEFRKAAIKLEPDVRRNPHVVRELKNLGSLIFSHLLPQAARDKLRSAESTNLYLRLDDQLVQIPWELAFDGQLFLGMKFRVGRQVITHHKVTQTAPVRPSSGALRMLLISDPSETLKNVSRESEQLCEILDRIPGLQVRLLGGRGVKRIPLLAALRESDIVHFAGHSQFDEKNPENSGWLLHDGLLSASEISKLDQAPLLVFSNSCQAGATKNWQSDYLYEGEAFGLGSAFLLAGVPNYIGTFCVVHDEESRFLAVEFYRRLAGGNSIGQALLEARVVTAEEMGLDRLTWASYMLYGDPGFAPMRLQPSSVSFSPLPKSEQITEESFQPGGSEKPSQPVVSGQSEPSQNHSILGWLSAGLLGAILAGFLLVMWWTSGKENAELTSPSGSSVKDKPIERVPGPQVKMGDEQGTQRGQTAPAVISESTTAKSQPEPKPLTKSRPQVGATGPLAGAPAEAPRDETSVAGRSPATTNQPTVSTWSLPPAQETYVSPAPKAFRDVGQFRFEVESVRASKNTNDVAVILHITNKSSRDVALALGDNPYRNIFLMDDRGYRYAYRNASGIGAWKGPAFMPTPSDWLAIPPFDSRTVSLIFGSGSRISVDSSSKFVLSAELAVAPPDDTKKGIIRPTIQNVSIQDIRPQ
jgi:CHAT domain